MKQLLFTCVCSMIIHAATAQGLTKNGQITSTGSSYVNKNGTVGGATGVNKNGQIVTAQSLPIVTTTAISSIAAGTATGGGNVTSTGGLTITSGICWNTATDPTVALSTKTAITPGAVGSFNSNLSSLLPNTTYYVRAYATNTLGTTYGDNVSFTTIALVIGSSYQGGRVFALTTDVNNVITGGWVVSNDRGSRNRSNAISGENDNSGLNGYTNWALPSNSQLSDICSNKASVGLNNTNTYFSNANITIVNNLQKASGVFFGSCSLYNNTLAIQQNGTMAQLPYNVCLVHPFTL